MAAEVLERATALLQQKPHDASVLLKSIVTQDEISKDDTFIKTKEEAIFLLGKLYTSLKNGEDLAWLIEYVRPFLERVSKAKAAHIVKSLVDLFLDMEAGTGKEIELCKKCIEWAQQEKRIFLAQALEARLVALHYDAKEYQTALQKESELLKPLKELDDKALLVEVQLMESKIYYALSNLSKSRAALTSCRTTANGIYCPPKLQAELDLQAGILHAADDRDFKTALSYFYEAFESFDSVDAPKAVIALKYMLMSQIVLNVADDVMSTLRGKVALKYSGSHVDAMKEIAVAAKARSLAVFQKAREQYKVELEDDPVVKLHLETLYDELLGKNLLRLIEPFSRVQVSHVSELINLPVEVVERKLSQMILDKSLNGILDQGTGVLVVFQERPKDKTYEAALETIVSMNKVIDALYQRAKKLT